MKNHEDRVEVTVRLKINGINPEARRMYRHFREYWGFERLYCNLIMYGALSALDPDKYADSLYVERSSLYIER